MLCFQIFFGLSSAWLATPFPFHAFPRTLGRSGLV